MGKNGKDRQHWLWVAGPEFYLNQEGEEADALEPTSRLESDDWWTCHRDTHRGDLILLYRTRPKQDIRYLIQAASDSYPITDNPIAAKRGWDYGCGYKVLYKFEDSVTKQDFAKTPYLRDWGVYTSHFRRRVFRIPADHWHRLTRLATKKNPDYRDIATAVERDIVDPRIVLEEQLEDRLVKNLDLLRPHGYNLMLYQNEDGTNGRQYVCKGHGGRMDLFCYDATRRRYVVIELKNVPASQQTFGQISSYMGWVRERIAKRTPVFGLVISRGYDTKFEASLKSNSRITQLDLSALGFK